MKIEEKMVLGVLCFIVAIGAYTIAMQDQLQMRELKNNKTVTCNQAAVEAIPDPNDTEARSKFLQDCFKN